MADGACHEHCVDPAGDTSKSCESQSRGLVVVASPSAAAYSYHQCATACSYRLPIDELKIDRSFVQQMVAGDGGRVLVRTGVALGHNLGITVVAEGIEDAETAAQLADLGCDVAQGYHFGRPMPAEDLRGWLREHDSAGSLTAHVVVSCLSRAQRVLGWSVRISVVVSREHCRGCPYVHDPVGRRHGHRICHVSERVKVMDVSKRTELAREALDGYASGPAACVRATANALAKVDDAAALVLVEGVSDQIAVETAAVGRGRDLDAERVVIVPIGGAHAIGRFLTELGPRAAQVRLAGLCDLAEEEVFRRGLAAARVGSPRTRTDLEQLGFYVCVDDLEDELLRAVGTAAVEAVFDSQGDLGSFRTMQSQPAWRGQEPRAQMRRFLGSGSHRKLRYARLLVDTAIGLDSLPRPLDALLTATDDRR